MESAQYGKETRIARGKPKMEGKNIEYLSVSVSRVFGIIEFLFIKITKTIDLQVMRETTMLRITRLSLSTGLYKKIRITLSTVASSVNIKTSECSLYFDVLATNQ